MVELSQTQRRTGQRPVLASPISTAIQPKNIAVSKAQVTGEVKSKTNDSANEKKSFVKPSSQQGEVKPVVKSQPPRKTEKKAISKVSSQKREQSAIFKTFSKPKPKLKKQDTGSSAGTSAIVTANSVRHSSSI